MGHITFGLFIILCFPKNIAAICFFLSGLILSKFSPQDQSSSLFIIGMIFDAGRISITIRYYGRVSAGFVRFQKVRKTAQHERRDL